MVLATHFIIEMYLSIIEYAIVHSCIGGSFIESYLLWIILDFAILLDLSIYFACGTIVKESLPFVAFHHLFYVIVLWKYVVDCGVCLIIVEE